MDWGINWGSVLILLLLLACPISMLLMMRGHRHTHGERQVDSGMPHEHGDGRRDNLADASIVRPLSELQRRQEVLERELETLKAALGGQLRPQALELLR